jgi:hypothetical protein
MEKSIETIWEQGFLKDDVLVAPKLNDLYNKKSQHIVDKFKRMYEINIIAIVVFALLILPFSYFTGIPYMGIPMFFLFIAVVLVNRKLKKKLDKIDNTKNSYQYLSSFDQWIKELVSLNTKLSRYLYPYVFLSMFLGFWFGSFGENIPGQDLVEFLQNKYPDMFMLFGLPLLGIIAVILALGLLALFGGRIGQWDLNLVYGRIIKKLDIMMRDMEELRGESGIDITNR